MRSTTSILKKLAKNYSQFNFIRGDDFKWDYSSSRIYYDLNDVDFLTSLIHELSHALLGHSNYKNDIELVGMEAEAWDKTVSIASQNNISIDKNVVDQNMDSYREWLHKRSTCPRCQSTGLQSSLSRYRCLVCENIWSVNEAKHKRLKRTNI